MPVHEFVAEVKGIGRKDYSSAVEITTEPFITSWQSGYNYAQLVAVPAAGSLVVDVPIDEDLVVILYDFFASIPSNRLIRLVVETLDTLGATSRPVDKSDYQAIAAHVSKGIYSVGKIRFTVYNYAPTPENNMVIGCAGMYTTLAEFAAEVGYLPPP